MAITCCAPIGNTLSSNSTKNSPASCATSFAPTTCATSGCRRDSIIWRPCEPDSRPLLTASPSSRPSASMCMSTSPCSSAWPCPSTSDRSVIPESRSTPPASSVYSRFCCTAATPWVAGPARQIHQAVLTTFQLAPKTYDLHQLRYDLRQLKGHALLQPDGSRYAYHLTPKGDQVELLFLFFPKGLCGP